MSLSLSLSLLSSHTLSTHSSRRISSTSFNTDPPQQHSQQPNTLDSNQTTKRQPSQQVTDRKMSSQSNRSLRSQHRINKKQHQLVARAVGGHMDRLTLIHNGVRHQIVAPRAVDQMDRLTLIHNGVRHQIVAPRAVDQMNRLTLIHNGVRHQIVAPRAVGQKDRLTDEASNESRVLTVNGGDRERIVLTVNGKRPEQFAQARQEGNESRVLTANGGGRERIVLTVNGKRPEQFAQARQAGNESRVLTANGGGRERIVLTVNGKRPEWAQTRKNPSKVLKKSTKNLKDMAAAALTLVNNQEKLSNAAQQLMTPPLSPAVTTKRRPEHSARAGRLQDMAIAALKIVDRRATNQ